MARGFALGFTSITIKDEYREGMQREAFLIKHILISCMTQPSSNVSKVT